MAWYWIVLIVVGVIVGGFLLLGIAASISATGSWGRVGDFFSAIWAFGWLIYGLVFLIAAVVTSLQTSRPFAAAAAWLLGISALLLVWAMWPPRSPRVFAWSLLLAVAGLACVATDLAVEGRPLEIVIWVPVIGMTFVGFFYVIAGLADDAVPRGARIARSVFGVVLLAVSYGVAAGFARWDLWALAT